MARPGSQASPELPAAARLGRSQPVGEAQAGAWLARAAGHESAVAFGLSALLVWLAQFHHFQALGLYEDDYFFIARAMGQTPAYLVDRLETAVTVLPQGRPLGFFLPDLLSFVGDKLGGLPVIYLLGGLLVTCNTYLCYRLLRVRLPVAPSVVGATVFCLFPADTTKILLTHDFQLQPALTFALLSALAYAAGRLPLAYLVAAGALLCYENGYLALFALPLFVRRWDRSMTRALAAHALALIGVLVVVVLARVARGEGRATGSVGGLGEIVPAVLGSLVLGPFYSLRAMFLQPVRMIPRWDAETAVLTCLALLGFAAVIRTARGGLRKPKTAEVAQVGGAGLAMLVLGYGLAFTHYPPSAIVGRGTSVHLGATLGMSVLAAAVAWLLLGMRARVAIGVLSAYLALAAGYSVTIERDFMRSWQLQRGFWQQVVACCSDLQDGTVLLYELSPADEPTTFIFTNSWADPLVLRETLTFPAGWANPPRLFSLTQWLDRVQAEGDHLAWWVPGASWDEHWEVLPEANVILLRRGSDGGLIRVTGRVEVAGQTLDLKPVSAPVAWPAAQLYEPLLK